MTLLQRKPWSLDDKAELLAQFDRLKKENEKLKGTAKYRAKANWMYQELCDKFDRSYSSIHGVLYRLRMGMDPDSVRILEMARAKSYSQMSLFEGLGNDEQDPDIPDNNPDSPEPAADVFGPESSLHPGPYPVLDEELYGESFANKTLMEVIVHYEGGSLKFDDSAYYDERYQNYMKGIVEAYLVSGRNFRILTLLQDNPSFGVPVLLDTVWKVHKTPDSAPYFVRKEIPVPQQE